MKSVTRFVFRLSLLAVVASTSTGCLGLGAAGLIPATVDLMMPADDPIPQNTGPISIAEMLANARDAGEAEGREPEGELVSTLDVIGSELTAANYQALGEFLGEAVNHPGETVRIEHPLGSNIQTLQLTFQLGRFVEVSGRSVRIVPNAHVGPNTVWLTLETLETVEAS